MAAALALLATMAAGVGAFAPSRLPSMSSPATRTLHASSYLSSSLGRPSFSLASKQASLLSLSGASRKRTEGLRGAQASSYGVVITGAAGGVGFSYADEFLARGHRVVICDISPKISQAADALRKKHSNAQLFEIITDVSDKNSVSNLASFAKDKLGTINYWINNAGINGGRRAFVEVPVEQVIGNHKEEEEEIMWIEVMIMKEVMEMIMVAVIMVDMVMIVLLMMIEMMMMIETRRTMMIKKIALLIIAFMFIRLMVRTTTIDADVNVEAVVKVNLLGALLCTQVDEEEEDVLRRLTVMYSEDGRNFPPPLSPLPHPPPLPPPLCLLHLKLSPFALPLFSLPFLVSCLPANRVRLLSCSGVKGGGTPGYVCYGATKRGQPQMTKSLVDELTKVGGGGGGGERQGPGEGEGRERGERFFGGAGEEDKECRREEKRKRKRKRGRSLHDVVEQGVQGYEKKEYPGDVKVHTLSPGMVFTQLLLDDSTPGEEEEEVEEEEE
eukprot:365719-Hanusia_phi.AAC.1